MVKIIFIDLDGTIWDCMDISQLQPPFTRISKNTIIDRYGYPVRLFDYVEEFLAEVRRLGIELVALSWNIYEIAYEALKAFDILKYFNHLLIEFHPHKGLLMKRYLTSRASYIDPKEIIYIDDRDIHIDEIRELVGEVHFIRAWKDFRSYKEFVDIIKNLHSMQRTPY